MSLSKMLIESGDPWLTPVSKGNFDAIPNPLEWVQTSEFGLLINGYKTSVALGYGELRIWANERRKDARTAGRWEGTAVELWCCLFYERRRYRYLECDPSPEELVLLNELCTRLRNSLQEISDQERKVILPVISAAA